ncbi:hypothetical protein RBY4I_2249 [Rhodobacterales bacterium Y4I]|nr:hypothetical protein RBY4I_2249 [Rhodobacterales bacterium Y4I]
MASITDLTKAEAEGVKLALAHPSDEGDLEGAISLLDTSIDYAQVEEGGVRILLFHALFANVYEGTPAAQNRRLH